MAKLTLRVPDDVYKQLQERATLARRSINNQIVYELEEAGKIEDERQDDGRLDLNGIADKFNTRRNLIRKRSDQ